MNWSKVEESTTNPGGTGMPACVISPSEAPLPPAIGALSLFNFLKSQVNSIMLVFYHFFWFFRSHQKFKKFPARIHSPDPFLRAEFKSPFPPQKYTRVCPTI